MRILSCLLVFIVACAVFLGIPAGQAATPPMVMLTPTLPPPPLDQEIFVPMMVNTATEIPTPLDVQLEVNERLSWVDPGEVGQNFNIIVVMDYSGSMKSCWDTVNTCPEGSRKFDYAIDAVRNLVQEVLVNQGGSGKDPQMALVGFGIQQTNSHTATIQVPLTDSAALFWEQIGSPTAPITISNSQLEVWNSTAQGLKLASMIIADARTVDDHGNPVRNIVIMVTDGIPNVLIDAPYAGQVNSEMGPYGTFTPEANRGPDWQPCVFGSVAIDQVNYQIECPRNHASVRSPIQATIDYGDVIRSQGALIWALQLTPTYQTNPDHTYLSLIADQAQIAVDPSDVQAWFASITQELWTPCRVATESRPAEGATLSLYTGNGDLITETIVPKTGLVTLPVFSKQSYKIKLSHLGVVAPNDPMQIARDYPQHWLLPMQVGPAESQSFYMDAANPPSRLKAILVPEAPVECP